MTSTQIKKQLRFGMALLAGGMALGAVGPAAAQTGDGTFPSYQEDAGAALSRHLRALAESPRNLSALTGAGKAALELGDAQAAATFYARAEEIAPRDGRIKAGMGSAFLAMEQAEAALKFFEDARALGAPEGEFAADRGLAHDLLGNPAQAQRDYALAMRMNDNDEVRRRMALSRAISGDRAGALSVIDAQLRRQDRSAWRVRAFVLALTGDAKGATEATRAVMPAQASAMQPFLTRLPTLRPAERAMAVHFGRFPGDAPVQMADATPQQYASASPSLSQGIAPQPYSNSGTSALPARRAPLPEPVSTASRRRPGYGEAGPGYSEERDVLRGSGSSRRRGVSQPVQPRAEPARPEQQPTRMARVETRLPAPIRSSSPPTSSLRSNSTVSQSNDPLARASVARKPVQTATNGLPANTQPASAAVQKPAATTSAPAVPRLAPSVMQNAGTSISAPRPILPEAQGPPAGASPPVAIAANTAPQSGPVNILPSAAAPTVSAAGPVAEASPDASSANQLTNLLPTTITSGAATPGISAVTPPASSVSAEAAPTPAPASPAVTSGLADIAATIRALPSEGEVTEEPKPAAPKAKAEPKQPVRLAEATAKPPASKAKVETAKTAPIKKADADEGKAPSRHWVQLASAPDALAASEYKRLKAKAPKLLSDTTGWKAPFRSTNRVLVGPFDDQKEAQALVNALAKANVTAVPWKSEDGQEIEKLPAK